MKFRMLLIAVALLAFASVGLCGAISAGLYGIGGSVDDPQPCLFAGCGSQTPLPDGFVLKIFIDNGATGPDASDVMPVVGAANFNTWNGYGCTDIGVCGTWAMGPDQSAFTYFTTAASLKVYVVAYPSMTGYGYHYYSESINLLADDASHDYYLVNWTCVTDVQLCEPHTASVTLVPNVFPFPATQNNVKACAKIGDGATDIIIPVVNATNMPHLTIDQGCQSCGDNTCDPIDGYTLGNWSFVPLATPVPLGSAVARFAYTTTIHRLTSGCCACIHLDFIEPVGMENVAAIASDNSVTLNWSVGSVVGITGFSVYRNNEKIADINSDVFTYTDTRANNGTTYSYKVVGTLVDGQIASDVVEATPMANLAVITKYDVSQNYPNPFNPSTTISFDVLKDNYVTLKVYNAMGQEVTTLANGTYNGGKRYTVTFDAKNLTSGLYFYTVKIGNEFSATKKMLLVK